MELAWLIPLLISFFFYSFLSRFKGAADPLPAPDPATAASAGVSSALNDGVAPDYKGAPPRVSVVIVVVVSSHIFISIIIIIIIIKPSSSASSTPRLMYIYRDIRSHKTSVVATLSAYKAFLYFLHRIVCHHYCTYSLPFFVHS